MIHCQVTWLWEDQILMTLEPDVLPIVGQEVTFTTLQGIGGPHENVKLVVDSVSHEYYLDKDKSDVFRKINNQVICVRLKLPKQKKIKKEKDKE